MIGLDGATLPFIQSHLPSLPHLRRAVASGALRRLRSTADLLPGSVWPTFYTGTLPGEHGIYHHLQWDAGSMGLRRVTDDWLHCEPFWHELERRGLRVIAVDVPMTFPPRLGRGLEVVAWGSHDEMSPFATRPTALAGEIRRRFGKHPMGSEIPVRKSRRTLQRIRSDLVKGALLKGELSRWLLRARDWDFFITVFGECHRGGHLLWPADGVRDDGVLATGLLDVYRAVDTAVGGILDSLALDQTMVVIFSLHGMGPNTSQEHFVPKIMERVNGRFVCQGPDPVGAWPPLRRRRLMRLLRENLPARLQHVIARTVPPAVRDLVVNRSITAGYDWPGTPGLALLADLNGYLRFNVRGREREGALVPGSKAFQQYVHWIVECFHSFRIAASGEPLVKAVCLAGAAFRGGRSAYLPDAIITWTGAPPAARIHSETLGSLTAELATGRAGNHRPEGFCIVIEPGSARRVKAGPGHIVDLAPLALQWLVPTAPPG